MVNTVWNTKEAEEATLGKANNNWEATSVSIDSRSVKPGDLFIAIKGEHFDGHHFVKQALEQGAVAAVVSHIPDNVPDGAPLLVVDDTFKALEGLGRYARKRTHAKVIAVTGSVGKTSTKEMLKVTLEPQGNVYATTGNLNNHLGVPLSLARMPKNTDFGVFELGMNHAGEIASLTRIAKPDVAIITTVAPAHLEFFDSVEAIADAKGEIFQGVTTGGCAIINRDNPHYKRLLRLANEAGITHIKSFGTNEDSTFHVVAATTDVDGSRVTLRTPAQTITYTLGLSGKHQACNSAAVLAAVEAVGGSLEKAAHALASLSSQGGRGKEYVVKLAQGVCLVIDDSYNASPASMQAALALLGERKQASGGRAIAVLGDMLELGNTSAELHKALTQDIKTNRIDKVYTAGEYMQAMYDTLPSEKKGGAFASSDLIGEAVLHYLQPGDVVLVKGSRGIQMEKVVQYILNKGTVAHIPGVAHAV